MPCSLHHWGRAGVGRRQETELADRAIAYHPAAPQPSLTMPNHLPPAPDNFLEEAITRLLHGEALEPFCQWFSHEAITQTSPDEPLPAEAIDEHLRYQKGRARELWQSLPVPSNRWRPRPLPRMERNSPCHCGSGRKYKQCCAQFGDLSIPAKKEGLYVLALSRAEPDMLLPGKLREIPPLALGMAADGWNHAGRHVHTAAVLEPLFEQLDGLDQRHELAFDVLVDALQSLGLHNRRVTLCDRVAMSRNKDLATAARCRKVSILSDQGENDAAWALLEEARRLNPTNPQLWHLELTLLHSQGRFDEARLRAPVLAATARKAGLRDVADMLLELGERGFDMAFGADEDDVDDDDDDDVYDIDEAQWTALCEQAPGSVDAAACSALYRVERIGAQDGEPPTLSITPTRKLADLQQRWSRRFAATKPMLTSPVGDASALLGGLSEAAQFLKDHPGAWLGIDVLDDLLLAATELCDDPEVPASVVRATRRLADHAVAVLRAVVGPEPARLEWADANSRPALRVLAQAIHNALIPPDMPRVEELASWSLELNPDDNHGWRVLVAVQMLNRGDYAKAMTLLDRYPHDMPPMACARVLCLFALGQVDAAEAALRPVHQGYPAMMAVLLPDVVDEPRPEYGPGVALGGEVEAWQHRQDMRAAWVRAGAIQWARGLKLKKPPAKKPAMTKAVGNKARPQPSKAAPFGAEGFEASHEQSLRHSFNDYPRLHGLLTAVAWSPDLLMPMQWLQPVMALRSAPAGNLDEMNADLDVIMRLYNSLNGELLTTGIGDARPADHALRLARDEPAALYAWAAGFVQGAELATAGWRQAGRPLTAKDGAFGALYRLAGRAPGTPDGWRAKNDQGQPLLQGLQDEASDEETLALALGDLWRVVAPLRQARAGR